MVSCCSAKEVHGFVRVRIKTVIDQWVHTAAIERLSSDLARRTVDKELVRGRRALWSLNRSGFRPMPRYFFNTRIGDELIPDPEGEELRDADLAWEIARAMIRELLKTEGAEGGLLKAILQVTDDEGEIVLEFPFTEALFDLSDVPITKH
jgi:hypothetical protein